MRYLILPLALALSACAGGGGPDSACEVFTPPPADSPTAQNDQRVEVLATADPTVINTPDERPCP